MGRASMNQRGRKREKGVSWTQNVGLKNRERFAEMYQGERGEEVIFFYRWIFYESIENKDTFNYLLPQIIR